MNDTPDESQRREWMADLARADQCNASLVDRFLEDRGEADVVVQMAQQFHNATAAEIRNLPDNALELLFTLGCLKACELYASSGLKLTDPDARDEGATP